MDLGIRNRVAIVSAGSRGLGLAAAHALAAEGVRLAICARDKTRLDAAADEIRTATSATVLAHPVDVEDPAAITRFVDDVATTFGGRVDILVNNAGSPPGGAADQITLDDWEIGFRRTFLSAVAFCRAALPRMKAGRWGRIVNIASISAKQPIPGLAVSNAMRPALVGYAKTLSREVAANGIVVNTVCPGFTATDHVNAWLDEAGRRDGVSPDDVLRRYGVDVPIGRMGTPAEVADVIAFLCSERAAYVNGALVFVDGGDTRGAF